MTMQTENLEMASRKAALIMAMNNRRAAFSNTSESALSVRPNADSVTEAQNIWATVGKDLASQWWQQHPAKAIVDLGLNALAIEARRHPVRLLTASSLVGATLVVAKPWRRMALGALFARFIQAGVTNLPQSRSFNEEEMR